jgi:hypothetical protein
VASLLHYWLAYNGKMMAGSSVLGLVGLWFAACQGFSDGFSTPFANKGNKKDRSPALPLPRPLVDENS